MKTVKNLSMAALVLMGTVITSCNKIEQNSEPVPAAEDNVVVCSTTVSLGTDGTKALTSTGVKTFAAGEQMAIIYKNSSNQTVKAVSEPLPAGDYGASATFTFTLTAPSRTENVTYIYPATMAASTVATDAAVDAEANVNYAALATQDGTLATLSSSLDYCTKSGAWNGWNLPTLTLENQLAILAITLKNNAATPADITSTITGMTLSDGTNSYAVTREAAAGPIYVAIRPTASASIDITATDGTKNYTKTLSGKTYAAGNGYPVSWRMLPAGALAGKFTINPSNNKVYFSKGNLKYNGSAWSFFDNQYDYLGTYSSTNWDLFGWSTSKTTYGKSTSKSNGDYSGDFKDWGNLAITNGGNAANSGWRTLTSAEWTYLFNTRESGSTVFGTSNARYAHATINTDGTGVNGMILFPDGVTIATTEVSTAGTVNGTSAWGTKCTSAQWTALESKGCVFLPAAGGRDGSSVYSAGSYGLYWSGTASGTVSAYRVLFRSGSLTPAESNYLSHGCSVRLVRSAE